MSADNGAEKRAGKEQKEKSGFEKNLHFKIPDMGADEPLGGVTPPWPKTLAGKRSLLTQTKLNALLHVCQ